MGLLSSLSKLKLLKDSLTCLFNLAALQGCGLLTLVARVPFRNILHSSAAKGVKANLDCYACPALHCRGAG
jgi:hypothetical protein